MLVQLNLSILAAVYFTRLSNDYKQRSVEKCVCSRTGSRTRDLWLIRPTCYPLHHPARCCLSHLSRRKTCRNYVQNYSKYLAGPGFEPGTVSLEGQCANHCTTLLLVQSYRLKKIETASIRCSKHLRKKSGSPLQTVKKVLFIFALKTNHQTQTGNETRNQLKNTLDSFTKDKVQTKLAHITDFTRQKHHKRRTESDELINFS